MHRNLYDGDASTWSPQGRVLQVEYATEAMKQGTCAVAMRNKEMVVICGLRRAFSKLADYNKKMLPIDSHVGAAFSGITADAKMLIHTMRTESLDHEYVFEEKAPIQRLVSSVSSLLQENTMEYSKRPLGAGLLIGGYDKKGPHIYQTVPSGYFEEYHGAAFGMRSQSASTFLEKHLDEFKTCSNEELKKLCIKALALTIPGDQTIKGENVHFAFVGKDTEWTELSATQVQELLDAAGVSSGADELMQ